MDDELKRRIAASLDTQSDAAADPDVTRALDLDPAARAFAEGLYTLDRALRQWPLRERPGADWERLAAAIDARVAASAKETAKVRKGSDVSRHEPDPAAFPTFEEPNPPMENKQVMSDPNDNDPDLEGLAALTRTSLAPGVSAVAPRSVAPSITDDIDDTSSGIVDIKKLAEVARTAASTPPPATVSTPPAPTSVAPAAAPAVDASASVKPASTEASKAEDKVGPPTRVAPVEKAPEPRKSYGPVWGIGGILVSAAAFMLYQSQGTQSLESARQGASDEPPPAVAAAAPTAPTPTAAPEAFRGATPTESPAAQGAPQNVAPPEPSAVAAAPVVAPAAAPEAAPLADMAVRPEHEAVARRSPAASDGANRTAHATAHTEEQGHGAQPTAAPPPAPAAPTPTPPPTAHAAPTPAAPARNAPAGNAAPHDNSINGLLEQVAPGPAHPAAQVTAEAAPTDLPERPNRQMITSQMTPLTGAVRACMQGATGTIPVTLVIGNDGAVRSARVGGEHGSDDVGTCVSNVVQRAHFPPFRATQATVVWPFVILPPH